MRSYACQNAALSDPVGCKKLTPPRQNDGLFMGAVEEIA